MRSYMWERHDLWWVGTIRSLVILALLIGGAILITRMIVNRAPSHAGGAPRPAAPSSEALRILEERFARGEIDETEFRARRDALRS
jgi:putative membrane protein